jgi:hypothetical protein
MGKVEGGETGDQAPHYSDVRQPHTYKEGVGSSEGGKADCRSQRSSAPHHCAARSHDRVQPHPVTPCYFHSFFLSLVFALSF